MHVLAGTVVAIASAILATGCGSSGTAPTTTHSGVTLASPRAQQVALALASNRLFSIFPARPGAKSCEIPEGGVHVHFKPLTGTCFTRIRHGRTLEPTLVVSFTEFWTVGPPCQPGEACALIRSYQHTWRVIEAESMVAGVPRLRIAAIRQRGSTAPQYYK
jgi:hypothetical protein